jgi:hypothetical protein
MRARLESGFWRPGLGTSRGPVLYSERFAGQVPMTCRRIANSPMW